MRHNCLHLISTVLITIVTTTVSAQEFVITQIAESKIASAASSILVEAYERLGYDVRFVKLPGERALIWSNEGRYADAEMFRIDGLEDDYPNLIKVPVSYLAINSVAFTKRVDPDLTGYEALHPYHVAFRIGLKIAEDNAFKLANVSRFADSEKAFEMLAKDRIDVVIEERTTGLAIIERLELEDIYEIKQPLVNEPLYHYVNAKHAELVPKLADIFSEMIQQGRVEEILELGSAD